MADLGSEWPNGFRVQAGDRCRPETSADCAETPRLIPQERTLVSENMANDPAPTGVDRHNVAAMEFGALIAAPVRRGLGHPIWHIVAVMTRPRRWTASEVALEETADEHVVAPAAFPVDADGDRLAQEDGGERGAGELRAQIAVDDRGVGPRLGAASRSASLPLLPDCACLTCQRITAASNGATAVRLRAAVRPVSGMQRMDGRLSE